MSVGSSTAMNQALHEPLPTLEGSGDQSQRSTTSKRARQKTSPTWKIFEEIKASNGITIAAKCLVYLKEYPYKVDQGTETLLKHKMAHDKKKVKLYLKIVEPLWSKHNLVLGEGILSTTLTRLEIFLSSIVYELKNHCQ
jgi:hypothetical protein